jgi:hypothetical protein
MTDYIPPLCRGPIDMSLYKARMLRLKICDESRLYIRMRMLDRETHDFLGKKGVLDKSSKATDKFAFFVGVFKDIHLRKEFFFFHIATFGHNDLCS